MFFLILISWYYSSFHYSNDEELNKLFGNVTIPEGGVIPSIQSALLPKTAPATSSGEKKAKKEPAPETD